MLDLLMNGLQILSVQSEFCEDTKGIWNLIGIIIFWIQIAIPVIIILLGTIDLGKAVISGDDKKVQAALKQFLMRLIYGAAIFFVVFIVQVVFGAIGDAKGSTSGKCWNCVAHRGCK